MSDTESTPVTPISAVSGTPAVDAAGASGQVTGTPKEISVSNMAELREQAPDVFKAMCKAIAMQIMNEMKDHADRLKKIMKDQNF